MLLQLRDFIKKGHVASLDQLSRAFHVDKQALQPMLDIWVNKGVIRLYQEKASCRGGCSSCKINAAISYEFCYTLRT